MNTELDALAQNISQFDLLFNITFFVAVCKLNHLQAVVSYSLA